MEIKCHFDHFNINVTDLAKSLDFYSRALGLRKTGEIVQPDGEFIINYLEAPSGAFRLGENESHLALRLDEDDFEAVHEYHKANGWVCFENPAMGIYFINDPDDYWIEILPRKRSNS